MHESPPNIVRAVATARATIYTDPACPYSWIAEPALRRLEAQFGEGLEFRHVMGGLAREFRRPLETMRHWIDAVAEVGMPLDPRVWLDAPPRSSYPACIAVKAAGEQGLDAEYLRRARDGFAFERRSLDTPDALVELSRTVPGLDVARFRIDLASNAITEAFAADLDKARTRAARGTPAGRIPLAAGGRSARRALGVQHLGARRLAPHGARRGR
jgi:putative protein-disulfide isomerase